MSLHPSQASYYPVSGTAAGTTVITPNPGSFERIIVGDNKTGTATFYDSATAAGTASTNLIIAVNNNSGSIPMSVEVGCRVKSGLVAVLGGTTALTVIYT